MNTKPKEDTMTTTQRQTIKDKFTRLEEDTADATRAIHHKVIDSMMEHVEGGNWKSPLIHAFTLARALTDRLERTMDDLDVML